VKVDKKVLQGEPSREEKRKFTKKEWGFVLATIVVAVGCLINGLTSDFQSGNIWGLFYGTFATVLLILAILLGVRRRIMRISSRYSFLQAAPWLSLHLYSGGLFLVLMLMHSGFHRPVGTLTGWVYWLSLWTVFSGLVGWGLQKWIPKVLTSGLSIEVNFDRIHDLVDAIRKKAEEQINACEEPVRGFCMKKILPVLQGPTVRLIYFFDITGGLAARLREFDYLYRFLGPTEKQKLDDLLKLYKTKLAIDKHYTLQRPLRVWLYAHLPVSMLLLVLVVIHVFVVLYY